MDFDEVADELYGLAPGRFTAARGDRAGEARAAGDRGLARRITALRRPTVAAWLANQLVRAKPAEADALIGLGNELRAAQADPSGDALRRLSRRRGQLVTALARDAEELARGEGQPVSAATLQEVAGTLEAALADPEAAESWRRGRLTGALHYSGLGFDVPLAAEQRMGASPRSQRSPGGVAPATSARERRVGERALAQAKRDVARASSLLEEADDALRDVRARIREAEVGLKDLRAEEAAASRRVSEARTARAAAQAAERKKERAVGRAG